MRSRWNLVPVILALVVTAVPAVASASEAAVPTTAQQEQIAGTQTPVPTVGRHASECSQTEGTEDGLEVDAIRPVQGDFGFTDDTLESAGSCFLACYDLETSHEVYGCPEGQNFAWDATGSFSSCCVVGGGECVTSGCSVLASQCNGFASSCSGSC